MTKDRIKEKLHTVSIILSLNGNMDYEIYDAIEYAIALIDGATNEECVNIDTIS